MSAGNDDHVGMGVPDDGMGVGIEDEHKIYNGAFQYGDRNEPDTDEENKHDTADDISMEVEIKHDTSDDLSMPHILPGSRDELSELIQLVEIVYENADRVLGRDRSVPALAGTELITYKANRLGYTIMDTSHDNPDYIVFKSKFSKQIVIAIRGTVPPSGTIRANLHSIRDFFDNIRTASGSIRVGGRARRLMDIARSLSEEYGRENITLTGHSLGGTLAMVVGDTEDLFTVALAPGRSFADTAIMRYFGQRWLNQTPENVISFRMDGDPVSFMGDNRYTISSNHARIAHSNPHSLSTFMNMAEVGENKEEYNDRIRQHRRKFLGRILKKRRIPFEKIIEMDKKIHKLEMDEKKKEDELDEIIKEIEATDVTETAHDNGADFSSALKSHSNYFLRMNMYTYKKDNKYSTFEDFIDDEYPENIDYDEFGRIVIDHRLKSWEELWNTTELGVPPQEVKRPVDKDTRSRLDERKRQIERELNSIRNKKRSLYREQKKILKKNAKEKSKLERRKKDEQGLTLDDYGPVRRAELEMKELGEEMENYIAAREVNIGRGRSISAMRRDEEKKIDTQVIQEDRFTSVIRQVDILTEQIDELHRLLTYNQKQKRLRKILETEEKKKEMEKQRHEIVDTFLSQYSEAEISHHRIRPVIQTEYKNEWWDQSQPKFTDKVKKRSTFPAEKRDAHQILYYERRMLELREALSANALVYSTAHRLILQRELVYFERRRDSLIENLGWENNLTFIDEFMHILDEMRTEMNNPGFGEGVKRKILKADPNLPGQSDIPGDGKFPGGEGVPGAPDINVPAEGFPGVEPGIGENPPPEMEIPGGVPGEVGFPGDAAIPEVPEAFGGPGRPLGGGGGGPPDGGGFIDWEGPGPTPSFRGTPGFGPIELLQLLEMIYNIWKQHEAAVARDKAFNELIEQLAKRDRKYITELTYLCKLVNIPIPTAKALPVTDLRTSRVPPVSEYYGPSALIYLKYRATNPWMYVSAENTQLVLDGIGYLWRSLMSPGIFVIERVSDFGQHGQEPPRKELEGQWRSESWEVKNKYMNSANRALHTTNSWVEFSRLDLDFISKVKTWAILTPWLQEKNKDTYYKELDGVIKKYADNRQCPIVRNPRTVDEYNKKRKYIESRVGSIEVQRKRHQTAGKSQGDKENDEEYLQRVKDWNEDMVLSTCGTPSMPPTYTTPGGTTCKWKNTVKPLDPSQMPYSTNKTEAQNQIQSGLGRQKNTNIVLNGGGILKKGGRTSSLKTVSPRTRTSKSYVNPQRIVIGNNL